MSVKPLVGVSGPDRGGRAAWLMTSMALARIGARARRLTPSSNARIDDLDALVVGGGADVDPGLYRETASALGEVVEASVDEGGERDPQSGGRFWAPAVFLLRKGLARRASGLDRPRDELEQRCLESAVGRGLPILGICRGAQLMNVFFGGTLYPDLADFYVESPQLRTVLPRKKVTIEPSSHLASVIGGGTCSVNALHHQAVRTLGEGMLAVAKESNGVVQAIERTEHPFQIGVQWHPEFIPQQKRQQRLFRALVDAAR